MREGGPDEHRAATGARRAGVTRTAAGQHATVHEQPRAAPPVTIHDPSGATVAALPVDEPSRPPRRAAGAVLLLLVALVAVALEVRERRATDAQDRRAAGQVLVHADAEGTSARHEPRKGTSDMAVSVRLGNDGPRPISVVGAELAGFTLRSELTLAPGAEARMLLRRTVACPPPPLAVEDRAGVLALQVRTQGGTRQVDVPLTFPVTDEVLAQGCGFGPSARRVSVQLVRPALDGDALRLPLAVRTSSLRPVQVQAVLVGPGLRATGLGADPLDLPVPEPGEVTSTPLDVRVSVEDCATAQRTLASGRSSVTLAMTDEVLNVFAEQVDYDPSLLRSLVRSSCSGGATRAS